MQGDDSSTRLPTPHSAVTAPHRGDALCFELSLPAKATGLRLGRANTNDIVINDATVSRSAEALTGSKPTFLCSMPLAAGQRIELSDEQKIKVGDRPRWSHRPT